jgi:hypothetical protein
MTTAEQFRAVVTEPTSRQVTIAGVPWPAYKAWALVLAFLVFAAVVAVTGTVSAGVLTGAAVGTLIWAGVGLTHRNR